MAVEATSTPLDPFLRGSTSQNTRGLLRIIILCTIAAAAVSARLFSVIRMFGTFYEEPYLCTGANYVQALKVSYTNVSLRGLPNFPSFSLRDLTSTTVDPWFNFRATKYLVKHGFYSFWDWFDDREWQKYKLACIEVDFVRDMASTRSSHRRDIVSWLDGYLRGYLPYPTPPRSTSRHPKHMRPPGSRLLWPHSSGHVPANVRNVVFSFRRPLSCCFHGHYTWLYLAVCGRQL